MQRKVFTLRLSATESARLANLAEQTGRSQGATIRRLLLLADLPVARALLGDSQPIPRDDSQEVTA